MEVLSPFPQETPEAHDHRPCSSESEKNPDPLDHFLHSGPPRQTDAESEVRQRNFQGSVEGALPVQGVTKRSGQRNQDRDKPNNLLPLQTPEKKFLTLHPTEPQHPLKTPVVQRELEETAKADPDENFRSYLQDPGLYSKFSIGTRKIWHHSGIHSLYSS